MHITVFRTVLRNSHEDTLGMSSDHGKFHEICRIEKNIGILLIRIDPLHLRASHIRPVHDGLTGSECTLVEVTDDTSEKTIVAGRDTVVVIEGDAGDRIDEDPVLCRICHLVCKTWVQSMDSLYEKYRPRLKSELSAVILSQSCDKVIFRNIHGLPCQKLQNITLEVSMIHGLKIIEVKVSVWKSRSIETIYEIVIGRERYRAYSAGLELNTETLAES
jgi:hypothetical protein